MSGLPTRHEAERGWDEVLGSLHGAPFDGQDVVHAVVSAYIDGALVPVDIDYESCDQCGGKIAIIRGRFPYAPDRKVCPTCVVERLEELVNLFNVPEAAALGDDDE